MLCTDQMRMREESEQAGLNLCTKNTKIVASSPITPWQIEGEKVEVLKDFLFLGCAITAMVVATMESKDGCFLAGKL